jgi:putative DNA primase/helicase
VFLCRGCGAAGDVIALVRHIDGVGFGDAVRTLGGYRTEVALKVDHRPIDLVNQAAIEGQNTKWAQQIWNDAGPITGTPAQTYLHGRGLFDLPGEDVLRFHPACQYGKTRTACLLSLYRDIVTNKPKAIARTAIGTTGTKIGRMTLGPVKDAAIKIDDDTDIEQGLAVGEGLETVLAGRQLGFRPCWALGSAGAIRTFLVLPGIEVLTILVDNDPADQSGRRAGDEAATECWRRWSDAGREVRAFTTDKMGTDITNVIEGARHG